MNGQSVQGPKSTTKQAESSRQNLLEIRPRPSIEWTINLLEISPDGNQALVAGTFEVRFSVLSIKISRPSAEINLHLRRRKCIHVYLGLSCLKKGVNFDLIEM